MVAQAIGADEDPSDSSAFCIVGDDLQELVDEAARHFEVDVVKS